MGRVLFISPMSGGFAYRSVVVKVVVFDVKLALAARSFGVLTREPFSVYMNTVTRCLVVPFLTFNVSGTLGLPSKVTLKLVLMNYYPNNISSGVVSCLYNNSITFSIKVAAISALLSPFVAPLLMSFLTDKARISVGTLPVFISVVRAMVFPMTIKFLLGCLLKGGGTFTRTRGIVPNVTILNLTFIMNNIMSSRNSGFFASKMMVFTTILLRGKLKCLLKCNTKGLMNVGATGGEAVSVRINVRGTNLTAGLTAAATRFTSAPRSTVVYTISYA